MTPATAPRRVLYVVSLFPCWSETFIVREIEVLLARGVDVRILSLKPPMEALVHERAARLLDRTLHPRPPLATALACLRLAIRRPVAVSAFGARLLAGLWRQPTKLLKSIGALARAAGHYEWIRRFDPELVHAPWATYPATVAWFLSRLLQRPFTFTSRAHDIFTEDQMMAGKLRHAALRVTITRHNVAYLSRWMRKPGELPVHVVHSSLDLADIAYVEDGRLPQRLLSVGRLDPIKGFDVLLHALALLRDRGVAFDSVIIGEGAERARLLALRDRLGLGDRVSFAGAKPQAEVHKAMAEATLMVMPCVVTEDGNADGIPNVLTEAMASGLAVVSTRVSGIPELVDDGVNGLLVPPRDAQALAAAVEQLLADPARRAAFARAGRRKVEQDFNVHVEAGRLLRHFAEVVHG
ncbi:glycosyltransferase, group 1 family protein [Mizugakiibacter sediminis]|uniref:Glycosyl transferase family 1 n=1 Tax=Mizugakiibacter sediminis TaxID=1475481 RepID=A0A0K8QN79_9GAMM|nr:glycosyltransferase [Mizugakiibacter sediminis]GAP66365.1 glycosyltransferase, group 1 family protein [Mizugakiibacter sediminis]